MTFYSDIPMRKNQARSDSRGCVRRLQQRPLVGSIVFLGPGIKGNRVIGATDDKQFGVALNPATLATDKDKGIKIRPEHIHEALREFAGIVAHPHAKKFPLGLTDKEKLQKLWG